MGQPTDRIVWQRSYDEAGHRLSMERFWKFYVAPAALLIVTVAILSGVGPAAGLLILLGLFGGLLFVLVWLRGRNERTNPTVSLEAGYLCWANRRVAVADVSRFTTYITSARMATAGAPTGSSLGAARFLLVDGNKVEFVWPALDEQQLDNLRGALEETFPGRFRTIDTLHTAD